VDRYGIFRLLFVEHIVKKCRVLFLAAVVLAVWAFLPSSSAAESYFFSVPSNYSDVYVNQDGSITIMYAITFANNFAAPPIEVVDIGLPTDRYNISTAKATIDNAPLVDIRPSTYIKTGIEVHLGSYAIGPGQTKTLYFQIDNPQMIYTDDEKQDYSSVEFSPTWFDSHSTYGTTDVSVTFHFPPGVKPDETIYHHNRQFDTSGNDEDGRIFFTFREPQGSPSAQYLYGISFPAKYAAMVVSGPSQPPSVRKGAGSFVDDLFIFLGLLGVAGFLGSHIFLFIFLGVLGFFVLNLFRARGLKMHYLPANVAMEGVIGIKRGLTAPQAAILSELPLNQVVTMILFGLLKKGIVRVETSPTPRVFKLEGAVMATLNQYELDFLKCIMSDGTLDTDPLKDAMVAMINAVNASLDGFSRTETIAYYRGIVDLAWKRVQDAATPELLGKAWDENLEWTMMDKDYDKRMEHIFSGRTIIMPRWYGNYSSPTGGSAKEGPLGQLSVSGAKLAGELSLPGANFANEIVGSVEKFSGRMISNVESFTTGVSRATNPVSQSSSSSFHSSSFHSSSFHSSSFHSSSSHSSSSFHHSCACACAGGGR
jgi:hypothetical protein